MTSVLVPVLYIGIVISSLTLKQYAPYFPTHPERDVYVSLLQKTDPPVHEALLKAALLRRAMTDVSRVVKLREDKPALQNLLQKGSVGDDLWNSLLQGEKELEAEIMEVVAEANSFVEGWGYSSVKSKERLEQKYGKIGQKVELPPLQPLMMAAQAQAQLKAQAQAAQQSPARAVSPIPATPGKPANGLAPPTPGHAESNDGNEDATKSSKSPKKNKKRK
ncbi:Pre protein translocase subunit Sec66-domain-containing protein [Melanogaster broomeanus]|nr:Pre protein translocase subunit Sec66-domain-containing protein [Melanogaster broomeanus]